MNDQLEQRRIRAWLRTTHGEYRGYTVASIIRRVYGPRARLRGYADPNEPGVGLIVVQQRGEPNTWRVLAKVWEAGGPPAEG